MREEGRSAEDREETPIHIWFEENKENFIIPPRSSPTPPSGNDFLRLAISIAMPVSIHAR